MICSCTIYFEDPFWIALLEREDIDGYRVARFVFGAEPGDPQLIDFALHQYAALIFSQPQSASAKIPAEVSFKRRQRQIHRQMESNRPSGTRAQQALKADEERRHKDSAEASRLRLEQEEQEKFQMRQEKKKARRRGH